MVPFGRYFIKKQFDSKFTSILLLNIIGGLFISHGSQTPFDHGSDLCKGAGFPNSNDRHRFNWPDLKHLCGLNF